MVIDKYREEVASRPSVASLDASASAVLENALHVSACAVTLRMTRTCLGQKARGSRRPRASSAIEEKRESKAPMA